MAFTRKDRYTAEDLMDIIRLLRDKENGCPWDKVQTHQSIRMNFLEEAYEAVDAIDLDDPHLLCEELGDVLMQVAFHTCIEEETARFDWHQVCDGVCKKLILRHPHIFGAEPGMEGINDWDSLKNREKGRLSAAEDMESVPKALPALMQADKLQKRASRYDSIPTVVADADAVATVATRLQRAQPASDEAMRAAGELLFSAVAMCREAQCNPEEALLSANERFAKQAPDY